MAPSATAAPTPPPNPTDGQISAAQRHKADLAAEVGALSGQIARAQGQLAQLAAEQELAEQKFALAVSQLQIARAAAVHARHVVTQARHRAANERIAYTQYLQSQYISGDPGGTTGELLTAKNPEDLLNATALEQYLAQAKLDQVGRMEKASVAVSNADAKARLAVANQTKAAARAKQAKLEADEKVRAKEAEKAALQDTLAANQTRLDAAQSELATLNHQRAQYEAYQAEQRRLARIRAARLARERAQRLAAERAARARQHHGGGFGNGGGGGFASGPAAPSGGNWTQGKANRAVARARSTLGTPYAWAGGGQYGPSRGFCDPSNGAPFDCNVIGYDCSGLVMYAWGRGWAHYAATQFTQVGSFHPSIGGLRRGDLLFYSSNGSIGGIHHVAIYVGGGQIIEAPFSGGNVRYASMYGPGPIFGATRPLT